MKTASGFLKAIFAFSLIALLFTTVSCKDDEEKTPEPVFTLVGKWQYTSLTLANGSAFPLMPVVETSAPCLEETKFTFNEDKSFTAQDCETAISFLSQYLPITQGTTWSENNGKLTLTNGSVSQELTYTTGKDSAGKSQISIVVPVSLQDYGLPGEVSTKFTFTKIQ